jgi:uncharacterized protein
LGDSSLDSLRAKLDEFYAWPSRYVFKFIAPTARVDELEGLFKGRPFTTRFSRTGKYVSITAEWELGSSEEVISYYREAQKIRGIIAL